ncbi:MAG: single-stranded-DNA-specific exonuclease RecJ, partial [Clostridia bacterium]|nr:single-stranded-DNA-specific exonuclease RecJ [Clostridia bacterium]
MPIVDSLSKDMNIHPVIAKLLEDRGIKDSDAARAFMFPSLDNLCPLSRYKGLDEVAARLRRAIDNGERVVIYGDYDCDGICATAMLYIFLTDLGVDCAYYIPDRHTEGYGINADALETIAERYYPDVIVSVDCGITSVEEVAYATDELGIDMIITDHHEPSDALPDCPVFNPKLSGEDAYTELCGAGVALRLIEAMSDVATSKKFYDIAALATVADVVPLTLDNRIIVYFGLKLLNMRRRRGIKLLADSCVKGDITSYDIAFKLAPRINSTGRIETAAETVSLFYETDVFMLESLVDKINNLNDIRRTLTDDLTDACIELLRSVDMEERKVIVLYNPYWDEGVLGITASRLVELYNRPVLLMTDSGGVVKGSGRSVKGIDIYSCLKECSNYLIKYGGHKMACGFTIDKQLIKQFDFVINSYCSKRYPEFIPAPQSKDGAIPIPADTDINFARQLEMLQPYGEGNPKPSFYAVRGRCAFAEIGGKGHLKERDGVKEWPQFNAANNCDWYNGSSAKRFDFRMDY